MNSHNCGVCGFYSHDVPDDRANTGDAILPECACFTITSVALFPLNNGPVTLVTPSLCFSSLGLGQWFLHSSLVIVICFLS